MADEEYFAHSIAVALYGPDVSTVYHPEKPKKQRCCILISEGSHGGVHDMVQIACGETWRKAAVHAVLAFKFGLKEGY